MSAVLFGSISTVADTSELQRRAFNEAFEAHGLEWQWDRDDYLAMLEKSGGQSRIAEYANSRGEIVDASAVHETKSKLFQQNLTTSQVSPRPGVVETIQGAKRKGLKVGLVTTTSPDNIAALMAALSPDVSVDDFDVIVDFTSVDQPKPDSAAYDFALDRLSEQPGDCVAVEDNVEGVQAALTAHVACIAFPNENTAAHDFAAANRQVDRLEFDELHHLIEAGQTGDAKA